MFLSPCDGSPACALDAIILTGLVLVSPEGLAALLSPHADALATALAVLGLLVISQCRMQNAECRMKRRWGFHSAFRILHSAFFVAALMTKFSAVAAPAAAAAFLFQRHRKRAGWLLVTWAVLSASGLALLEHLSDGRFLANFRGLGSGGMSLDSIRIGPSRFAFALSQTFPFSAILALALFASLQRGREQGFSLWDWYFLFTAAITLVIFTSPGTGLNHLLELEVAAVLAVAQLLFRQTDAQTSAQRFLNQRPGSSSSPCCWAACSRYFKRSNILKVLPRFRDVPWRRRCPRRRASWRRMPRCRCCSAGGRW